MFHSITQSIYRSSSTIYRRIHPITLPCRYRDLTGDSISYQTLLTWAGFDILESAMYLSTERKTNSSIRVGKYTNQMNPNDVLINLKSSQVRLCYYSCVVLLLLLFNYCYFRPCDPIFWVYSNFLLFFYLSLLNHLIDLLPLAFRFLPPSVVLSSTLNVLTVFKKVLSCNLYLPPLRQKSFFHRDKKQQRWCIRCLRGTIGCIPGNY